MPTSRSGTVHGSTIIETTVSRLKDPLSKRDCGRSRRRSGPDAGQPEILLLVLIDVIEFKFQHFQGAFDSLPARMCAIVGTALTAATRRAGWRGHDPAFVLAAVYHYFFHFALIEKHMRGNQHLGVSNELAIKRFVDLLFGGAVVAAPPDRWRCAAADRRNARPVADARRGDAGSHRVHQAALRPTMARAAGHVLQVRPQGQGQHQGADAVPAADAARPARRQSTCDRGRGARALHHQGFHGTNIRDIADKPASRRGRSIRYYPEKEKIFESLVRNYQACMLAFTRQVITLLEHPFSRGDLRLLATAVRSIVYDELALLLLMFIDVIEFKNRHFAALFHDIPAQFRYLLGPVLNRAKRRPGWCGQDPAFVLATIYLFFYNYFVIERHMRGNQHLGPPEQEAIERLIDLLSTGLWGRDPEAA